MGHVAWSVVQAQPGEFSGRGVDLPRASHSQIRDTDLLAVTLLALFWTYSLHLAYDEIITHTYEPPILDEPELM